MRIPTIAEIISGTFETRPVARILILNMKDSLESTLTPLEQSYWDQFLALFNQVNPQKPEVGCRVMIERARVMAAARNIPLSEALETLYNQARQRTERRMQLLGQCRLERSATDGAE